MDKSKKGATIDNLSSSNALVLIGQLVDQATDEADIGLADHSLRLADKLEARSLPPAEMALLDYFRANAWACREEKRRGNRADVWDFEQPEVAQQLFLLRRAMNSPGFAAMDKIRRYQIQTNIANLLDTVGRFVEARANWTAVLAMDPNFWMARGNRARGLMHYARALSDEGHACVCVFHAHSDLVMATKQIGEYPHFGDDRLLPYFSNIADQISQEFDVNSIGKCYNTDEWDMGVESTEREYRQWCLENVLFLNPLNDIEAVSIAARDVMSLPDFHAAIKEPPIVTGMFNELKQGYVSARWMLWDGIRSNEPHMSDREVRLYNTLDYPAYGLAIEKVKIAFRMAYSTFDKIAYFLNHYLALGIQPKFVSFRTIWREKGNGQIRAPFATSENWPLRGLFWLSKDLFEEGIKDLTEPDARAIADLRNHLEHKYVKVVEMLLPADSANALFHDTLAHTITRSDLERRTLRLMQLARSALIYLLLGMHREEQKRRNGRTGLAANMTLELWRDEWKR